MKFRHVDHAQKEADARFLRIWFLGGLGFQWHRANRWHQEMVLKPFCRRPICKLLNVNGVAVHAD